MLWLIWILLVLGIIAAKVYMTKTMIRVRFRMENMKKQLAKIKMEDKVARGNLDIGKRALSEVQRMIPMQTAAIATLNQSISAFEEQKKKKTEETKKKILR